MVKVISLSNEAYEKLSSIKRDRSFSEVVVELIDKKKDKIELMKFAGAFKNVSKWSKIKEMIEEDRKKSKLREVRF
tara:strand:- start:137 stop:364 length:228 start_codon:yes stop_codon:yes gene_type:complete